MTKNDRFFNDVSYWSNKLNEARNRLVETKALNLPHEELSIEEKYKLQDLLLDFHSYTALLSDVVKYEIENPKKTFWQKLLKK